MHPTDPPEQPEQTEPYDPWRGLMVYLAKFVILGLVISLAAFVGVTLLTDDSQQGKAVAGIVFLFTMIASLYPNPISERS